ncbi:MAG: hypothetical protein PHD51_00920 [Patescibacteria group bacterium]|nr:hypothetical protein [Patescibacteria group bacterium]MDD5490575.1 hypothetical protein [Patescibacteria group bacterium]
MITNRQKTLLNLIIDEYVRTAEPVGSKSLASRSKLNFSPATLRNEMAGLEKDGYIHQPHTSAGRVPTEKGFNFYIKNFLREIDLTKEEKKTVEKILHETGRPHSELLKAMAKALAELSGTAVIVGFEPRNFYYTGIANLFSQPEFRDYNLVCDISLVIDQLDEGFDKIFKEIDDIHIFLGKENPFAENCGSVLAKYNLDDTEGVLGILGPMRMNYSANYSLLKYTRELINNK